MIYYDTSIIVAAVSKGNPRHRECLAKLVAASKMSDGISAHSLTEIYSVLTRLPGQERLTPRDALAVIDTIHARFRVTALSTSEHFEVVRDVADRGLAGGIVHDAIILRCAEKGGATSFLTLNAKDFMRARPDWSSRILEP